MLKFLLYNKIFDSIITIFWVVNTITTFIVSIKIKDPDDDSKTKTNKGKYEDFKSIVILINVLILFLLFVFVLYKYNISSIFVMLYYSLVGFTAFKILSKNINDLTSNNKMLYMQFLYFYSTIFSVNSVNVYISNLSSLSHIFKEYLVIAFLIIKIVGFTFWIIINISIFISNFYIIFKKIIDRHYKKISNLSSKYYHPIFYDFYFSNKNSNKKYIIFDKIIFILSCPLFIIINLFYILIILTIKLIFNFYCLIKKLTFNYFNNTYDIFKKYIKICVIISFVIVYIAVTYENNIFKNTTKEIYNLFTTVLLIPLIYDSIKAKPKQ